MSRLTGIASARGLTLVNSVLYTSPAFALRNTIGVALVRPPVQRLRFSTILAQQGSGSNSDQECIDVRVATYNVLSSHLADPARFTECKPEDLDAPTRLQRVKAKLETEIEKGSVVCLQEVSTLWSGELHVFFMSRGYALVMAPYGARKNGYMGVGLAWPLDKYESLTVNISRVSETREWGREPRATRATSPTAQESLPQVASAEQSQRRKLWGILIRGLIARLSGKLKRPKREGKDVDFSWTTQDKDVGRFYNGDKEREGGTDVGKEDPWKVAERRYNQALFARLRLKGNTSAPNGGVFCVGTYHMPCMFMIPAVMTIHTSMAIKHLAKLAGPDPLVFGGDFNFTPDSDCYKLATQGELPENSSAFPERPEWEKDWSADTGVPLSSTYKEVQGEEPNFTNHAKVVDSPTFIATLDYLFYTKGMTPTKVLPLVHRDEIENTLPMETEPSDHLMLAAEYRFQTTSGK